MICGFVGQIRHGKTVSAVRESLKYYYNDGKTIYSNIWLSIPYKPLTIDMLLDVVENDDKQIFDPDSVVLIDEIHIWLDSRMSASKRNKIVTYFLLQTGKMGIESDYGLILLYTTQWLDQIDKRLRHTTEVLIECEKKSFDGKKYFKLTYNKFEGFRIITWVEFYDGEPYYPFFRTKEIVHLPKSRVDEDAL